MNELPHQLGFSHKTPDVYYTKNLLYPRQYVVLKNIIKMWNELHILTLQQMVILLILVKAQNES